MHVPKPKRSHFHKLIHPTHELPPLTVQTPKHSQRGSHKRVEDLSAKRKSDILSRSASLDLAAAGVGARGPGDGRAAGLGARHDQLLAAEGIAKDGAEVVPDGGAVEAVGVVELGSTSVETVGRLGDLDGLAARGGVLDEGLRVGAAIGSDGVGVAHAAADGPEGHGLGALVDDLGVANGGDEGSSGREGEDGEVVKHFEGWLVVVVDVGKVASV